MPQETDMKEIQLLERITLNPKVMVGKPVINGIFKSTDDGENWSAKNNGL